MLPVFVWLPEKQAPKQGFKCKLFVLEVSLGSACGWWGQGEGQGKKADMGVLRSRSPPCSAGLNPMETSEDRMEPSLVWQTSWH